ncbi:hypothetical protein [Streptomyces sp. NPDC020681]|uniref:hypothetical protein n=1 Tax=Streptomyces sp. NPDC020681 TaxID=3365083 RepID=UPI0037A0E99A
MIAYEVFDRIRTIAAYHIVALSASVVFLAFLAILGWIGQRAAWWLDRRRWRQTATFAGAQHDDRRDPAELSVIRLRSDLFGQAPLFPIKPCTDRDALDTCRAIWDATNAREEGDCDRRNR